MAGADATSVGPRRMKPQSAVLAYMLTSVGMTVANKRAVSHLRAGTALLGVQFAATSIATCLAHLCGLARIEGELSDVARWAPVGILDGLLLWAGIEALKHASLSTLTVVRNSSPLFVLIAEWLLFGRRPTKGTAGSLVLILVGVMVYTWDDLQRAKSDVTGVLFILLDAFLVSASSLLERFLLAERPVRLSTGACVLVANTVGLLPVLVLLVGPFSGELSELKIDRAGILWGIATLPVGVLLSAVGVILHAVVTATASLVVSNVDKVVVLFYGVLFMGDHMDAVQALGCLLSLTGGLWHGWARLRATRVVPASTTSAASPEAVSGGDGPSSTALIVEQTELESGPKQQDRGGSEPLNAQS